MKREVLPFVSCLIFQGQADGFARTRQPINFAALYFFDVLPSRHPCRLSLNPRYASSLLFLLRLHPPSHGGAALPRPNNEAKPLFSRRAPACSSAPPSLSGRRIQVSLIFNLKSETWTGNRHNKRQPRGERLPGPERAGALDGSVFQRPALPGLAAADVGS